MEIFFSSPPPEKNHLKGLPFSKQPLYVLRVTELSAPPLSLCASA